MLRRILLLAIATQFLSGRHYAPAVAQSPTCADFDAWVAAQTLFEAEPDRSAALDSDGNGIACDDLRDKPGFAPAHWTTQIPPDVFTAEITGLVDGDTLEGVVNGQPETIELYRAWVPDLDECGGLAAMKATEQLLGLNSNGATVSIEQGDRLRFDHGELLAYIWLTIDGNVYLLNEALIRSGWADDFVTGDTLYDRQMRQAEEFARTYALGAWQSCPNGPDQDPGTGPAQPPTPTIIPPEPRPTWTSVPTLPTWSPSCDPSYPDFCIPPITDVGDLDCWQIDANDFTVLPPDPHHFDDDEDGLGCEPYVP